MTLEDHCNIQHKMFELLRGRGYSCLQQNVFYSRIVNGIRYIGEIDLIGKSPLGYYLFCEVKSSPHKFDVALEQFHRYVYSHPDVYIKGIMVSRKGIRRLHLPF